MKIFFDTEFTGLNQKTTLISIWLISEDGKTFYWEFTDYDKTQIDSWLQENVINNLVMKVPDEWEDEYFYIERHSSNLVWNDLYKGYSHQMRWDHHKIKGYLKVWFSQFDSVEMWSDCLSYDWVLFNTLMADYSQGYPKLPKNVNYIPFDICTLFKMKWIDPDISREEFSGMDGKKHNALYDAEVIRECYNKLIK